MLIGELAETQVWLAAPQVVEQGEELEESVQVVRYAPTVVTAEVAGGAAHVELRVVDGSLAWFCTCGEGRKGVFCAHCVATTLARRRLLVQSACRRTDR